MIYITTVYDSLNYGSYFQAHALEWYLSRYDKVLFLDINHQSTFNQTFKYCLKHFLKLQIQDSILNLKKYEKFVKAKKTFNVVNLNKLKIKNNDIFVFGSDEIWNIEREKIRKSKEFFGDSIESDNKISYAVSINTSTIDTFNKYSYTKQLLNKFKYISVRDFNSKNVIEKIVNKECKLVVDPTLLVDSNIYRKIMVLPKIKNYILIYTYGKMLNSNNISEIKEFARNNNKKIISVGKYFDFCDYNIAATPEQFLGYVNDADFVFTDTFHGLMFSIILKKQFVIFKCNNIKVENTLNLFKLDNRLKTDYNEIKDIILNIIDYKNMDKIVNKIIVDSKNFLNTSIESLMK